MADDHLREILAEHGVRNVTAIEPTASEIDRTLLIRTASGRVVLKESPVGSDTARMQAALLAHVAEHAPQLPAPRLLLNTSTGRAITETSEGTAFVTTFCSGSPLEDAPLSEPLIDTIVQTQSELIGALAVADAEEMFVPQHNDWSIDEVITYEPLIDDLATADHRPLLHVIVEDFRRLVLPKRASLPAQVLHADFNLSNLLVDGEHISGIIDFGDAIHAPRVYDVAVTACYLALAAGSLQDPLVERYLSRISAQLALTDAETALLPTLILARLAIVLLLARESARRVPSRASYVLRYDALAVRLLDGLSSHGTRSATATATEGTA